MSVLATASRTATVEGAAMATALDELLTIVPRRSLLPVLSHLLVNTADGSIQLTASNLDATLQVDVPASGHAGEHWAVCVPARSLRDILGEGAVTLELLGQYRLRVSVGDLDLTLQGVAREEFPTTPSLPDDAPSGLWDPASVAPALQRCAAFSSTDQSRPILAGVMLRTEGGVGDIVATNGHLLRSERAAVPGRDVDLILSRDAIRILAGFTDVVEVSVHDSHVHMEGDGRRGAARLIAGPYPNYREVFPKSHRARVVLAREPFLRAVEAVEPIASDQTHRTALTFDGRGSRISVETPDIGTATHPLPVLEFSGEPITVGANAEYLKKLLTAAQGDTVTLELLAPERAITMYEDGDAVSLLMPLRLLDY